MFLEQADTFPQQMSCSDLIETNHRLVGVMLHALEQKTPWAEGHSTRVADLVARFGLALGLPAEEVNLIRLGAYLHDIGKIAIPDRILQQPGPLTAPECKMVQAHPAIGAWMLRPLYDHSQVPDVIRHHHERIDGTGYPDGLTGNSIPLGARMCSIADAWDTMSSQRPYRTQLTEDQAMAELWDCSGMQFDSDLVTLFLEEVILKTPRQGAR